MIKKIEDLIEENKNLIYKIASKYRNLCNIEDLFQVGSIGLIKAYKNYRLNSAAEFTTYAYKYILGEIIEFIRNDRNVKVSSDMMKIYKAYEKSKDFLTNEFGREATLFEISSFMNVDPSYLSDVIRVCAFTISLDAPLTEEEFSLENLVGEDKTIEIDNSIDLRSEIESLPDKERKIIELRYFEDLTQSETARALNMTQVQVSRSENSILKKMKSRITA